MHMHIQKKHYWTLRFSIKSLKYLSVVLTWILRASNCVLDYMCGADVVSLRSVQWEVLYEFALFAHPLGSSDNPSPMA